VKDNTLKDKVIMVTGGAGLLGRAFSCEIIARGGTVVIASRDSGKSNTIVKPLIAEENQHQLVCENLDITDPISVTTCFSKIDKAFGRIDAVVNNSLPVTKNYGRKFEEVELSDFNASVNAHLGGYFNVCQESARYFSRQGMGNIVNIGSVYGVVAPRFQLYENTPMTKEVEYAISKAGIIHLTKYLAAYLKGRNIRVNCLSPGGVLDGQSADFVARYNDECLNKGMLDSDDITGALCFLLSENSKYLNGHNLIVDDGFCAAR
jgi:NAD(P)-dependent dehydrogenase (short-subunit alcohol dehydrogenase family)